MKREIVSLNECHIKRQSTKNATESTVSLGEKFTSFESGLGHFWVRFGSSLGRVWVGLGSLSYLKIHGELYFAPNYQFFSFHFFIFSIFEFFIFQWSSNIFNLGIFRILTVASSDGQKRISPGPEFFDISGWTFDEKRFKGHLRLKS